MTQKKEESQNSWTVILIGTKWGTLSFHVPRVALFSTIAVIAVCLALAGYGLLRMADGTDATSTTGGLNETGASKTELDAAQKEIAGLKEKLRNYDNQFIAIGQKPPDGKRDDSKPYDVAVEQFRMRYHPEDTSYHFQFVLRASALKRGKASGYIFIMLRSSRPGYENGQAYPSIGLKDRRPVNFKDGEHFAISRQKTIQGAIKKIPGPNIYETADVLIYSDDGMLLWEKSHDLKGNTER